MDTKHALLGLVGAGTGYGYDLKHNYDRWFQASKPLAFGQVYATLARLLRDGLIAARGVAAGAGPERKHYEITPAGRAAVTEWMFQPVAATAFLRPDLFAKTVIALLLDEDADRLLDAQRSAHRAEMRELTRRKQGADLHTVLLADHALFHLEADLRWIDLTAARLAELRAELRP